MMLSENWEGFVLVPKFLMFPGVGHFIALCLSFLPR